MLMRNQIYNEDCLWGMRKLPAASIDMVLCDPPYGVTRCAWDKPLPLEMLWEQYLRVVKEDGAIVLFSAQPFTSALVQFKPELFRYEWIWHKPNVTGHLNAKKAPLRAHENILVFYRRPPVYHPQMTHGHPRKKGRSSYVKGGDGKSVYGREVRDTTYDTTDRYPTDIQTFPCVTVQERIVPTQKPVELCEYLIRTYTEPGDTVLDNCMGSGTTAEACIRTGRSYIGFETDPERCAAANRRAELARTLAVQPNTPT